MPVNTNDTFMVDDSGGGALVRAVRPRRGEPYEHRCPRASFETVAHAIDEAAGQPLTLEGLVGHTGLPWTAVNVAFAFMKERGCVRAVHGRRHVAGSACVHLDAMTEYHALREGAPGSR